MLTIVRSHCEGQHEQEQNGNQEKGEDAKRWEPKFVTKGSIKASVREVAADGLRFVNQGWSGDGSWLTVAGSVEAGKANQYCDSQDCRVVPSDPMAILILQIVRNLSLRKVVRGLKCEAGVVVAMSITQR